MKLSACLIVKNEEENIGRCLSSLVGFVDQIVIVDTGSDDATMEVALRTYREEMDNNPARLTSFQPSYFEWTGDFSAARNHSMDLATGERILIIDADEYVTGGWDEIRGAIEDPGFICGTMLVVNKTKQGPVNGERIRQPRLFRNVPELRYKYAVHNQIDEQVLDYGKRFLEMTGEMGAIVHTMAEMIHTGYDLTSEQVVSKYTPRLATLRDEIKRAAEEEKAEEQAYYEFQLALMLHMVYNVEDAVSYWETLDFSKLNKPNRWYAHYIASRAYLAQGDFGKSLGHCDAQLATFESEELPVIAREPISTVLCGVVMCTEAAITHDAEQMKQGLIMMIDGYFRCISPPTGARCIVNPGQLQQDIAHFAQNTDPYYGAMIASERDAVSLVRILKEFQHEIIEFDESILEGVL